MPCPTFLLLLSLLTLGAAHQATAQGSAPAAILKGRVLDAKTGLPVPYASLWLLNETNWTLTNAKGHFELAAPKIVGTDTLLVECPGYRPRPVVLRNLSLSDTTFFLEREVKAIKELVDPSSAQIVLRQVGALAKKPGEGMIQGLMGSQYALLMQPSPKQQLGSIRNVSFFIGESGFPKESFRIRIYRADGPNHSPGTNLLTENLIVSAPSGGQWFTVDISKYYIDGPQDGFFVAMEWIVTDGPVAFDGSPFHKSQIMRPTFEFKQSLTWAFTVGKGWQLLALKTQDAKFYNAMIRAEIEVVK